MKTKVRRRVSLVFLVVGEMNLKNASMLISLISYQFSLYSLIMSCFTLRLCFTKLTSSFHSDLDNASIADEIMKIGTMKTKVRRRPSLVFLVAGET